MANRFKPRYGINAEAKFPKLNAIKKDPISKSILDKLVSDPGNGYGYNTNFRTRRDIPISDNALKRISNRTTQNVEDAGNIFQLLPDTELAMQILVSSILSPKDMINVELGYKIDNNILEGEIAGALIEVIHYHFEEHYKIKSFLPKILEDCLFKKGSYPIVILPESSIDEIINSDQRVSFESLRYELNSDHQPHRSIGLLGDSKRKYDQWSLESYKHIGERIPDKDCEITIEHLKLRRTLKGEVVVSDNINILKFPKVINKLRGERIKDTLSKANFGLEARRKKNPIQDEHLVNTLYRNRQYQQEPFIKVKAKQDLARPTQGHPLVMKLPPECVIPVHVPSNPEEHIGYFVLLDQYGNPINSVKDTNYYRDLSTNLRTYDVSSQLMEAGKRAAYGMRGNDRDVVELETIRAYADIIEKDLLARLKNGIYGESVEIARPLDVYRIMLARSLASKGTQILYIPLDLMTYIAFDYNKHGVGKSLLDDNKVLASIRAMLLFSNTMAAIKNSTGKTSIKIQLDEDDPDPSSTVEYMIHEYSKNRKAAYPLGASNPLDIIDFLQNAGVDVQVSGNTGYPETTMSVDDYSNNKTVVDDRLEEDIKKRYFMSMGLSPETIDMTSDVEFATSIVTSNLLLAKRVMIYQDILLNHIRDFVAKYVTNSSFLWDELLNIVENNKTSIPKEHKELSHEELLNLFLNSLEITLPRPDSAKLDNQFDAYNKYTEFLERALEAYLNEDAFSLEDFELDRDIRAIKASIMSYYQREWLRTNNVLPELMDLVLLDKDGKPELDLAEIHGSHLKNIGMSIAELIKNLRKQKERREKFLEEKEDEKTDAATADDTPEESGSGDIEGEGDTEEEMGDEEEGEGEEVGDEESPEEEGGDEESGSGDIEGEEDTEEEGMGDEESPEEEEEVDEETIAESDQTDSDDLETEEEPEEEELEDTKEPEEPKEEEEPEDTEEPEETEEPKEEEDTEEPEEEEEPEDTEEPKEEEDTEEPEEEEEPEETEEPKEEESEEEAIKETENQNELDEVKEKIEALKKNKNRMKPIQFNRQMEALLKKQKDLESS